MPSLCVSIIMDTSLHPGLELRAQTKPNPATNHFQPLRGVVSPYTKTSEVSVQNFPPPGL